MPPVALHHRVTGPTGAPPVVLGGSLGSTLALWDELVADLAIDHRVVTFDLRGHGSSPSAVGPLEVADLASDVLALARLLRIDRFDYVGISLGGAIGQQIALDAPERLRTLVLACTSARFGDPQAWTDRARAVRLDGLAPLRMPTGTRWFTEEVEHERTSRVDRILDDLVATDAESYAVLCEALGRFDVRERLGAITTPTLVLAADQDPTCPPAMTGELRSGVPGATAVVVEGSAHLANICRPEAFASAVREHLAR